MLSCSIGKISNVIVRKAFSGFTSVEFNVPVDEYADSDKFKLTIDNVTTEYVTTSNEVYMQPGDKTLVKVTGILSSQDKWLNVTPMSAESAEAGTLLKGMGISNGPSVSVTFLNLFLTKGQMAIALANMTSKSAFINFEKDTVAYYSELYKKRPLQVDSSFRRVYSRAPQAGYIGWDSDVSGSYPGNAQAILPFGNFTNTDKSIMKNLVENCNNIAKLFSDMQMFTASYPFDLGDAVLSNLTNDKKVVVAAEEHYDETDNLTAVYYCV